MKGKAGIGILLARLALKLASCFAFHLTFLLNWIYIPFSCTKYIYKCLEAIACQYNHVSLLADFLASSYTCVCLILQASSVRTDLEKNSKMYLEEPTLQNRAGSSVSVISEAMIEGLCNGKVFNIPKN